MASTSDAIRNQINQLTADLNKQVAIQNLYAKTGVQGIKGAYAGLGSQLKTNLGEIKSNLAMGRQDLGAGYDYAQGGIGQAGSAMAQLLQGPGQNHRQPLADMQRLMAESKAAEAD